MSTYQQSESAGCLTQAASVSMIAWAAAVPALIHTVLLQLVWYSDISKTPYTPQQVLPFGFLAVVLTLAVAAGLLIRDPRHRAVAQTLTVSAVVAGLLMLPRVIFAPQLVEAPALTRLVLTLLAAVPLLVLAVRRGGVFRAGSIPLALLLAAPFALPWVRLGALGSPLDTLQALAQGLALGLLVSGLIGGLLMPGLRARSGDPGIDLVLGGLTIGAALVGIGGAFGQDDLQAFMMPVLAGAAIPAVALALPTRTAQRDTVQVDLLGPALLSGLVAALPLAFADPEEIALIVGLSDDTYKFTQGAAFWSLFIGLVLWAGLQFAARRLSRVAPQHYLVIGAAVLWAGVGAAYATSGQTGFYGNHFLIVMSEQADLSQAATIGDLTERRRFVYTTLVDTANRSQADLRALLDARGVRYTPFYLTNAIEVDGDALLQAQLSGRAEVDRIIFSQALRPLPAPLPLEEGTEFEPEEPVWSVTAIGADRVWDELDVRGVGIVVGQSDSGVDWTHPALREGYRGGDGEHDYNWYDPWTGRAEPWDGNGHGTHTIATVLGRTGTGVAPDAEWFGCANLVRNIGNPGDYLHCMQFMLAPFPIGGDPLRDGDPARAADISTNSWGCPPIEGCDSQVLLPAAQALRDAGIFFVVASGNEGPACGSLETPPGILEAAISIGAIDYGDQLAEFSSRGPASNSPDGRIGPTLLAPGVDVISAWPGGGYESTSGTSMATPHVAGVVALMWSANPALRGDVAATEKILIDTARPYEGSLEGCGESEALPNPESGYGIVDAYAAVEGAMAFRR